MTIKYDEQEFYRAHLTRDARFDGKFFVAVKTTKIYCRPVCPARKAKLKNLSFYLHAAQAEEAGYRPCLRCRPETAPGSPAWMGTSTTVRRAMRMMDTLASEAITLNKIAEKLGVSERWLRKLFQDQLGVNPQAFLLNKKLDVAKNLLEHSDLTITNIAFSSGFNSIRRFNDAFLQRFKHSPRHFKSKQQTCHSQSLYLRYRPPFAFTKLLQFYAARTIPMMEQVDTHSYQRLISYDKTQGFIKITQADDNRLRIDYQFNQRTDLLRLVTKIKDMFDLDADPMKIEDDLKQDQKLKPLLDAYGGLRIPGCFDGFELAVRAIIGQLISVKAAKTILTRLTQKFGKKQHINPDIPLTHCFPTPETILQANLQGIGLPQSKINSIKALAQALNTGELRLDGTADYAQTCQRLLAIKGIGPWTVQYIAMRGLKNPDAFPDNDLELKKRIDQFKLNPNQWKPWRAYAAILLFNMD